MLHTACNPALPVLTGFWQVELPRNWSSSSTPSSQLSLLRDLSWHVGCRGGAIPTRRCGHLGTHGTLTCGGYGDWRIGAGRLGSAIGLGLPSGVKLTGNANKNQLLSPSKDTVFPLSPFPRIPPRHTGNVEQQWGSLGVGAGVGDVGELCAPRGFWKIPLSGSTVRVWALEVFGVPVLPS